MERISRTIDMAKSSWAVLRADRELLWLPVLSAIASLIAIAVFFLPALLLNDGLTDETGQTNPMAMVLMVAGSLLVAMIAVFFQGALVHGADERLGGGDPTVSSAIRGAMARLPKLLGWAVVNFVVGSIIRAIRERGGLLGGIGGAIAEMAWNLITFLAVPVVMIENRGPIDTVKRSTELFKRTWGENVAAQIGFGLLGFVAVLPAVIVIALGAAVGSAVLALAIVIGVVYIAAVIVTITALNAVFQTVLYRYAADGVVPDEFGETAIGGAFDHK
ncbi:MAG: DUF6159 family protein [Actinomycetota bacterium]